MSNQEILLRLSLVKVELQKLCAEVPIAGEAHLGYAMNNIERAAHWVGIREQRNEQRISQASRKLITPLVAGEKR